MRIVDLNQEDNMAGFLEKLKGSRTIIMALVFGVDAIGAHLGYWHADAMRTVVEEVMTVIFLRLGMK